ncbi:MAG: hypothetical protein QXD43_03660 [Candidatus Aenigmatarchaeota archaeon]
MALQELLMTFWNSFLTTLPAIITCLIILIIGFIVGKVAGRIAKEILVRIKIDKYISEKEKFKLNISELGSLITKWTFYIWFIQLGVAALGISELTSLTMSAVNFLLGAVGAVVIILVGYVFACFVKDRVVQVKTFYGDVVGNLIFFLIIYVSVALALPFVKIDPTLINWLLIVIVASLGIGLAIAIGLGLKDVIAETAKGYSKKFRSHK